MVCSTGIGGSVKVSIVSLDERVREARVGSVETRQSGESLSLGGDGRCGELQAQMAESGGHRQRQDRCGDREQSPGELQKSRLWGVIPDRKAQPKEHKSDSRGKDCERLRGKRAP